jgi:hypothetical protein
VSLLCLVDLSQRPLMFHFGLDDQTKRRTSSDRNLIALSSRFRRRRLLSPLDTSSLIQNYSCQIFHACTQMTLTIEMLDG